ncbi:family 43 glycosylhydrolase [Saccharicrinis aurantiacus]|uniref:family 43 glycosylhydrolase n=1 Tax=Saccharicrinis aurantiacus TaxID=1849719 RepID=UPI00249397CA|nr:family 43 glycosylhydrolase [Saccharicrinis aurantiacus]
MKRILNLVGLVMIAALATAQNPFVTHKFTADPSARVFNGRLYVYSSHDRDDAKYFDMEDWACFSTTDMVNWTDHGKIFSLDDISWAEKWAWAPDCIERNGKYYFYYPVERKKIGVAVADKPEGPFKDVLGKPLVDGIAEPFAGAEPIDPTILIDDDGQAYMYFGCREARVVKLKKNMIKRDGKLQELKIYDKEGNRLLWREPREGDPKGMQISNGGDGVYGEGPWILKKDGKYLLIYANGWAKDATMVYASADNPMGPFTYEGKVMQSVSSGTSHGSIVEYKGQWYVFYHTKDLSKNNFKRSICVDKLEWDENGKIIPVAPTREGVIKIN